MAGSVYSRALQKAAELCGGRDELCRILKLPRADVDRWIADEEKAPRDVFLRVVDLILDESAPAGGEGGDAPPPRDAAGANRHLDD
jgi:hypothetical protein